MVKKSWDPLTTSAVVERRERTSLGGASGPSGSPATVRTAHLLLVASVRLPPPATQSLSSVSLLPHLHPLTSGILSQRPVLFLFCLVRASSTPSKLLSCSVFFFLFFPFAQHGIISKDRLDHAAWRLKVPEWFLGCKQGEL